MRLLQLLKARTVTRRWRGLSSSTPPRPTRGVAWEDSPTIAVAQCPEHPYDVELALSSDALELSPACTAALSSAEDPYSLAKADIEQITTGIMGLMGRNRAIVSFVEARFAQRGTYAALRPTIALLMADAVGEHVRNGGADARDDAARRLERDDVRRIASIAEMLHMATRLHSEVTSVQRVDGAASTVSASPQDKLALLAGDFLLARASVFLSRIRRVEIVEMLATVLEHLVVSGVDRSPDDDASSDPLEAVRTNGQRAFYRTASLTAHSCLAAAIVGSGGDDASADELAERRRAWSAAAAYGENIGLVVHLEREADAAAAAAAPSSSRGLDVLLDELVVGTEAPPRGVAAIRRLSRVHANRAMEALVDGLRPSGSRDALLRLAHTTATAEE